MPSKRQLLPGGGRTCRGRTGQQFLNWGRVTCGLAGEKRCARTKPNRRRMPARCAAPMRALKCSGRNWRWRAWADRHRLRLLRRLRTYLSGAPRVGRIAGASLCRLFGLHLLRSRGRPRAPVAQSPPSTRHGAGASQDVAYEVGCATGYHRRHFRRSRLGGRRLRPSAKAVAQARSYGIDIGGMDADALPARKRSRHRRDVLSTRAGRSIAALKLAHAALKNDGVSASGSAVRVPCAAMVAGMVHRWSTCTVLANQPDGASGRGGFAPVEFRIALKAELIR